MGTQSRAWPAAAAVVGRQPPTAHSTTTTILVRPRSTTPKTLRPAIARREGATTRLLPCSTFRWLAVTMPLSTSSAPRPRVRAVNQSAELTGESRLKSTPHVDANGNLSRKRHVFVHASPLGSHTRASRMHPTLKAQERSIAARPPAFSALGKPRHPMPWVAPMSIVLHTAHGATRSHRCMAVDYGSCPDGPQLPVYCCETYVHAIGTPHPRLHPPRVLACVRLHEHGTFERTSPFF